MLKVENNGIKIMILEGAEIVKFQKGDKEFLQYKYNAVLDNSILQEKLINKDLQVNKQNRTNDVICVKFSYGYNTPPEAEALEKLNRLELREKLYTEGFTLNFTKTENKQPIDYSIDYVYFFRSTSKSKDGSVLFINKELIDITKWQRMGKEYAEGEECKLVEDEAYCSLSSSSMVGKVIIDPYTEILVLDDIDISKDIMANIVYNDDNGQCKVKKGNTIIDQTIFDGQSLIEDNLFDSNNGMMVLRQHYFKTCGFRTYIQKFFKDYCKENKLDYDTFTVRDRYDRELLAKNIKLVTTENSTKFIKFGKGEDYFSEWCKLVTDIGYFAVCKTDHPSKYGDLQRMSYQMVNSLPIDADATKNLFQVSKDYIELLQKNDEAFITYLTNKEHTINANSMFVDLYNKNNEFAGTELFRTFKTEKIKDIKKDLKQGKLFAQGDNLTIVGNPYLMLQHSVGQVDVKNKANIKDITLQEEEQGYSVYTTRFVDKEELCAFRSPHNSTHNILHFKNTHNSLMQKYFNFSKNIIAINMVHTDVQHRANGCDQDSDFLFCSNNEILIQASKDSLKFNTIVNDIVPEPNPYKYSLRQLAKIDHNLSKNQMLIGQSSNLAQLALSYYWHTEDTVLKSELEEVIIICAVLAQIAIDSSKRTFPINVETELARLAESSCLKQFVSANNNKKYPSFFLNIKELKPKHVDKTDYIGQKNIEEIENDIVELKKELKNETDTEKMKELEKRIKSKKNKIPALINKIKKNDEKAKIAKENFINQCADMNTPMDYILKLIDTITTNRSNNDKYTPIKNFVKTLKDVEGRADLRQITKIEKMAEKLDNTCRQNYTAYTKNDEDNLIKLTIQTEETEADISSIKVGFKTMAKMVSDAVNGRAHNKYIRKLLNCLYKAHRENFMKCWVSK